MHPLLSEIKFEHKFSDLTCLFICKLKSLYIYWEAYYLLYFYENNLLQIWPTFFRSKSIMLGRVNIVGHAVIMQKYLSVFWYFVHSFIYLSNLMFFLVENFMVHTFEHLLVIQTSSLFFNNKRMPCWFTSCDILHCNSIQL